jgi:hypothetical protein
MAIIRGFSLMWPRVRSFLQDTYIVGIGILVIAIAVLLSPQQKPAPQQNASAPPAQTNQSNSPEAQTQNNAPPASTPPKAAQANAPGPGPQQNHAASAPATSGPQNASPQQN